MPKNGTSEPKSGSTNERLQALARELGFAQMGVAPATEADGFAAYSDWLAAGYHGTMHYLARTQELRRHPRGVWPPVRSVVMLSYTYSPSGARTPPRQGRVASYAQRPDYHPWLWAKLNRLSDWLAAEWPGTESRGVTDSAPLLERDFARRAGLGWIGKNTLLLNRETGSFFLLAALLTSAELAPDAPTTGNHCGTCTACLEACPTAAFVRPGVLDARKCISYLTIEHQGVIPLDLRADVGDWLFGCDVCQDVCPWNRFARPNPDFPTDERLAAIDPVQLLTMTAAEFAATFAGTPLVARKGLARLRRNAAVVLGNVGGSDAVPALERAATDPDPVVAEAAATAREQIRQRDPDNRPEL